MATYSQYNGSVGSSYYNFFLSKVPADKDYIIFRIDDYYVCIYGDHVSGTTFEDTTVIKISTAYGSQGQVTYTSESSSSVNVIYEYYTYSNVGTGTLLVPPSVQLNGNQIEHYSFGVLFVILLVILGFSIIKKRWI